MSFKFIQPNIGVPRRNIVSKVITPGSKETRQYWGVFSIRWNTLLIC